MSEDLYLYTDDESETEMESTTPDAGPIATFRCYERFLRWRFNGAHHSAVTPKALESATEEFWRFWDRAASATPGRPGAVPSTVSPAPKIKTIRDTVSRKDLAHPAKKGADPAPPKPRKRLVPAADRRDQKVKKPRRMFYADDEAVEVSHREAMAEDAANESEDEGSLVNFVVHDSQDNQGSSPLL